MVKLFKEKHPVYVFGDLYQQSNEWVIITTKSVTDVRSIAKCVSDDCVSMKL